MKSPETEQINFEKYKLKIELFKWLIGSVALVIATMVIDFGFRDRAAGLEEMQQYDKYITDLIVLNKEPAQRRMLAQFFANVTPSEKLKKGWSDYYKEVDKEYQEFVAPVLVRDSIIKKEYNELLLKRDTSNMLQTKKLEVLKMELENNQRIINPDIVLPSQVVNKDYNAAVDFEAKGFAALLEKDVENAILAFGNSENAYPGFHDVYEIGAYLSDNKTNLKDKNAPSWKTALKKISEDYGWKMPADVKEKMLLNTK